MSKASQCYCARNQKMTLFTIHIYWHYMISVSKYQGLCIETFLQSSSFINFFQWYILAIVLSVSSHQQKRKWTNFCNLIMCLTDSCSKEVNMMKYFMVWFLSCYSLDGVVVVICDLNFNFLFCMIMVHKSRSPFNQI